MKMHEVETVPRLRLKELYILPDITRNHLTVRKVRP